MSWGDMLQWESSRYCEKDVKRGVADVGRNEEGGDRVGKCLMARRQQGSPGARGD